MKGSKKLIALICSLAMIFSVFANFTIVNAESAQGMIIEVDAENSTATEKAISIKYVGMPDGIASYTVKFDIPEGATVENVKSGLTGEITDLTDNVFTAGATAVDNVKCENDVLFSGTIKLASELTEDFPLVLKTGTVMGDENGAKYAVSKGTLETTDAILEAPVPEPTAIPDAEPVLMGINLTLDAENSTELEKVIKASYAGYDNGIAAYTIKINVPEGATVDATSKLTGEVTDLTDNVYTIGATAVDNVKTDDSVFATLTVKLAAPLTEDFVSYLLTGTVLGDENGNKIAISKGTMPVTYVVLRAAEAAPTATPEPTDTAEPTDTPEPTETPDPAAPTATPAVEADERPTMHPTAEPVVTEEPGDVATPIPDAEPVAKGINLTLDEENSTELIKVVNASYAGYDNGIAAYTVKVNVPEGATVDATSKLTGEVTDLTDNVYTIGATAVDNVKADDGIFATLTVKLAAPLTEDFVMNLLTGSVLGDEDGNKIAISKGTMPETYVVLRATVVPVETEEPTAAPTEKPIVGTKALADLVSAAKAKEAEEAGRTPYVTVNVTKEDGTPAVYGEDYAVHDAEGNVVDKDTFENEIWGWTDTKVSDAINKYTFVAYEPIKVTAKLNVVGEPNAIDGGETVDVPEKAAETATPKPTTRPSTDVNGVEFYQWSAKSVTVTKSGDAKSSVASFRYIPTDAKDVKITFSVDDDTLVKINSTSSTTVSNGVARATVKVSAKKSKKDSTTVTATLEYTLDGKEYTLDSATDLTVNTKTSSSSSSSSGSSGGGGTSGGIIAGPSTAATTPQRLVNPDATYPVNFTDLDEAPWAADAIRYLAERGLVNGRSADKFEPNGYITRAEFAKLIVTIYGITVNEGIEAMSFSDVQSGSWYTPYVMTAAHYGIVKGYPDGLFRPDALVSRQEMALMMYRAATTFATPLDAVNAPIEFTDGVADWASEAVTALQVAGVVNGTSATTFGPEDASTRAQAAQMIYNLYQNVNY